MIAVAAALMLVSQAPLQRDDSFCNLARRNPDGSWTMLGTITLLNDEGKHDLTPGRVYKPGEKIGKLDIAKTLDATCLRTPITDASEAPRNHGL